MLHFYRSLKSEGMEFDEWDCQSAIESAAWGGHVDVLKYLRSEGVAFTSWTCYGAAEGGHLDVLKYLKSEGAPFDEYTCTYAAEGGYLEVLQWLRSKEVDCPWDIQSCLSKAMSREVIGPYHAQVVYWIETSGVTDRCF